MSKVKEFFLNIARFFLNVDDYKRRRRKRIFLPIFILSVIGLLIAGIVLQINANSVFPIDKELDILGKVLLFGALGIIAVSIIAFAFTKFRQPLKYSSDLFPKMRSAGIGPFAKDYKPPAGAKHSYFCEYCGFEVSEKERKCNECGGPIRKIKFKDI